MPSHHRRRHKDPEDEQHSLRVDEAHADQYSRPSSTNFRQTSNYRRTDSTSSSRGSYDMSSSRASSSRAHRDSSWRPKDTDEYYRERESWPAQSVPEPRYSEREWSRRYDAGYSTSSYSDQSSWATPSNTTLDHRNGHQERWQSQDTRGHVFKGRPPERTQAVEQRQDWNRDQRRGKEWPTGAGYTNWAEPPPHWNPPPEKTPVVDNRAWEPAPTWQPSGSGERRNHSRNDYHHETSRGAEASGANAARPTYNYNKPQRNWRRDDGNLNNWSRRESQGSERALESSLSTRKHQRSPTRSRSGSRSPAESHYSRRSSRGRTRSPSVSPASKRRRRDSSPIVVSGRPHDAGHAVWVPRQNPQPPESTHRQSTSTHRRNASPTSSLSAGRSRSRSPNPDLARSLHRLSNAVSAPAIASSPRPGAENPIREFVPRWNGSNPANGTHNKRRPQSLIQNPSMDAMPPPTIIPAAHSSRVLPELPRPSLPKMPMGPTRIIAKNPSFKPIGHSSSSLKKFFPGDEEDMDISSDISVIAEPEPQQLPHHSTFDPPQEQPPLPAQSTENPVAEPPLPRLPSSPLAPSRGSSVVMEDEPETNDGPQPSRPSSPPLQSSRQPDLDPGDHTDASTPSVHTRSELYHIVSQVGEGTFGKVYKAQNTVTKLHVALKRIRMESEKEGFPVTAMREIKLLQSLRHENVVRLYEMMVSNGSVYMVFEYMDHDLTGILSQTQFSFTNAHLKSLSHQMLAGLAYLHHKGVIHRDIKGSNILINNRGELKLADFGLARFYQKRRRTDYTNRVITLWYRPPELLFGATVYGAEVDMWSAGCIMLELFTKKPVFQGNDEIHQLDTIYRVIGTPTTDRWPDVANLPWYELVKPREEIPNHFREMFRKWMSPAALDLAEWLLCYDPAARATAVQAMEAPYFTQEEPPAMAPVGLATLHGEWHELETKRERAKKRRRNET